MATNEAIPEILSIKVISCKTSIVGIMTIIVKVIWMMPCLGKGEITEQTILYEAQELLHTNKQWKPVTYPVPRGISEHLYKHFKKFNPHLEFRIIKVETVKTVIEE